MLNLTDPRYRKWAAAAAGVAVQVLLLLQAVIAGGLLHGTALTVAQTVVAALTAVGVRAVTNKAPHLPEHAED